MIRAWLLSKFTQLSAWVGLIIIIGTFIFPRQILVFFGVLLMLNDDQWWKVRFTKLHGWISRKVQELDNDEKDDTP